MEFASARRAPLQLLPLALAALVLTGAGACRRRHEAGKLAPTAPSTPVLTARIAGSVVDGRAHPVPDARVLAFPIADGGTGGAEPRRARADIDGRFSIDGMSVGTYRVLVEAAGFRILLVEQAVEAIDAAENYQLASLDAPVQDDDEGCPLAEMLGSEDDGFEVADERQALATSWAGLGEVERQVLGLRLGHGLTQREISRQIGCSQMHVSRLLRRSMLSLDVAAVPTTSDTVARAA